MVMKTESYRGGRKMKRVEFIKWLDNAGFRFDETAKGMMVFSRGWQSVRIFEDNSVEVVFCSPCEYSEYDTCIECFELDKLGNLVVKIWVYGDDGEVEEEHYLYRY